MAGGRLAERVRARPLLVLAFLLLPAVAAALPVPQRGVWMTTREVLDPGESVLLDAQVFTDGGEVTFLLGAFAPNGTLAFDFRWTWPTYLGGAPLGARAAVGALAVDVGTPQPLAPGGYRFPVRVECRSEAEACEGLTALVAAGERATRIETTVERSPGAEAGVALGPATYARAGDFDGAAAVAHAGAASVAATSNAERRVAAEGVLFGFYTGAGTTMEGAGGRRSCDCLLAAEPAGEYVFRLPGNRVNADARLLAADLAFP